MSYFVGYNDSQRLAAMEFIVANPVNTYENNCITEINM